MTVWKTVLEETHRVGQQRLIGADTYMQDISEAAKPLCVAKKHTAKKVPQSAVEARAHAHTHTHTHALCVVKKHTAKRHSNHPWKHTATSTLTCSLTLTHTHTRPHRITHCVAKKHTAKKVLQSPVESV